MKGTVFQRPLEFNLVIDGESWQQGDPIFGTLTVRNHGKEPLDMSEVCLHLALGELKKVRLKSPEAFDVLKSAELGANGQLQPGSSTEFSWRFETDRNFPITDNLKSPFILYGRGTALEQLGQLELAVNPFAIIDEFIKTLQIQFRFVVKGRKWSKGKVEFKLAPPDSKALGMVEHLNAQFQFEQETLNVKYSFHVKKLEATAASVAMSKGKKETEQSFTLQDYRLPSGRLNHERIERGIAAAIELVQSGF